MNKVSVHIVTWNSQRFIENAMRSLDAQTFRDFSILIIDNGSTDKTVAWLKEYYPQIKIVSNQRNLGFAKAHNQAISFTRSDYVLVMNVDVILTETYLEKLVEKMDTVNFLGREKKQEDELQLNKIGSITGKIFKLIGNPAQVDETSFTKTIDSAGLEILKSRRAVDRGEGEIDNGQFNETEEVFGVSGNIPFYRRSALEDVKIKNEYFDEDFHAYKEDVDLAWRLRLQGWQAYFVPQAVAYHFRGAGGQAELGNIATVKNRRHKPRYAHKLSYRNHLMMLVKNEQNFWRHSLYIFWYEFRKLVFILFFEQKTLYGLRQFFKFLPKMRAKRKLIQDKAKVSAKQMRKWFK